MLVSCIVAVTASAHLLTEVRCYYPPGSALTREVCNTFDDLTEEEYRILDKDDRSFGMRDVEVCMGPPLTKRCVPNWQHWGDALAGRPLWTPADSEHPYVPSFHIPDHPAGEPYMAEGDTVIHILGDGGYLSCEECFDKVYVSVPRGALITWSNDSPVSHAFLGGTPAKWEGDTFFTKVIEPGGTHSLDTGGLGAGDYGYHCQFHPWEKGWIEVRGPWPAG